MASVFTNGNLLTQDMEQGSSDGETTESVTDDETETATA
jgi:hypothetical protein